MDKPTKEFDAIADKIIEEAGFVNPSIDFTSKVMEKIVVRSASKFVYTPLISKSGWVFIVGIFAISIGLLYLYPMGGASYFSDMKISELPQITNPFANLKLSKTLVMGIGTLTLFLVQIPFLKKLIEKPTAS